MSIIKDDFIRHNSMLIADTLIKIICDDLKFHDKQYDIEYIMMNSKLKADKQIKKEMILNEKFNQKLKHNHRLRRKMKRSKSKFANKYSDRIKSIRESDEKAIKKKKANISRKEKNEKKIEEMKKKKEEILKAYGKIKENK